MVAISLIQDYGQHAAVCAKQAHRWGERSWAASKCLLLLQLPTGMTDPTGPQNGSAGRWCLPMGWAIPPGPILHRQLKSWMVSPSHPFSEVSLGGWAGCPCCRASWGSVPSLCVASPHQYPYFLTQYLHVVILHKWNSGGVILPNGLHLWHERSIYIWNRSQLNSDLPAT